MEEYVDKLKEEFIRWGGGVDDGGNSEARQHEMRVCYEKHLKAVGDRLKRKRQTKQIPPYYKDFLFYVAYFWGTGRGVYAASMVHDVIKGEELSEDELLALEHLQRFLRTHPSTAGYIKVSSDDEEPAAKKIISHFNKSELAKIDGMESLLDILGEEGFIKAVIENSYFLSPELVHARFDEMARALAIGEKLYARKSTQDDLYQMKGSDRLYVDGSFKCPIVLDKDGNAEVRKVINTETGYTISQGKGSIFQNYCISHVWGKAYDPRYFSSLWNLAIVPAWGNSLMDKMADEESDEVERLAARLKATIESVCSTLYKMDELCWKELKMSQPLVNDAVEVKSQTLSVFVLEGDMAITKRIITI